MLSSLERDPAAAFLGGDSLSGALHALALSSSTSVPNSGSNPSSNAFSSSNSASTAFSGANATASAFSSSNSASSAFSSSNAGASAFSSSNAGEEEAARASEDFDRFLRDRELMQLGLLRALEDSVRHMAEHKERMLTEAREFVGRRMRELARGLSSDQGQQAKQRQSTVDELFERREAARGLVGWLPAELQTRATESVRLMREDIAAGDGNGVRTSFYALLAIYMRALGVQQVLNVSILGEPLGTLITQYMKTYLSAIQQCDAKMATGGSATSSASSNSNSNSNSSYSYDYFLTPGSGDAAEDGSDQELIGNFDTDVQRLIGALYCIKNVGNWASHNRGALGYFKQLELCGAIGAMAETLPNVWRMYQLYKEANDTSTTPAKEADESWTTSLTVSTEINSPPPPPPLPTSSVTASSPKLPPGLLSASTWASPRNSFSVESGLLSSTSSSPQHGIWSTAGASPSKKPAPQLPPGLPPVSTSNEPPSSHTLFRSQSTPSTPVSNLSTPLPPPMPPLPPQPSPSSVLTARPPSPIVPKRSPLPKPNYHFYYNKDDDIPQPDGRTKVMFRAMLEHMRLVDEARLCQQGLACPDRKSGECKESHTYQEVMTYNPLYKLIKCTQADHFSYIDVQEHAWCVCGHVDIGVNTDWMNSYSTVGERNFNSKVYMCEHRERCTNGRCYKSHSEEEICWYNPFFRTKECEFGRGCRFGSNCLAVHDGQHKRQPSDGYIGIKAKMLFLERTHRAVAEKLVTVDPRYR